MARYRISIQDIVGRNLNTEDGEAEAAAWLWRTLVHLRETWPTSAVFDVRIVYFEKLDGP
jgi:hypothetical protein